MDKKIELKNKIIKSNIVGSLKAILLDDIDKYTEEQISWLIENL